MLMCDSGPLRRPCIFTCCSRCLKLVCSDVSVLVCCACLTAATLATVADACMYEGCCWCLLHAQNSEEDMTVC